MDAAIVDDLGFIDFFARSFEYFSYGITQKIVANMSEMQRFVGVGR
jgi:hypothetical protein